MRDEFHKIFKPREDLVVGPNEPDYMEMHLKCWRGEMVEDEERPNAKDEIVFGCLKQLDFFPWLWSTLHADRTDEPVQPSAREWIEEYRKGKAELDSFFNNVVIPEDGAGGK